MSSESPLFAEWVENTMASESNPTRRGRFVRVVRRTGRLNPGVWWEMTDGHGSFWQVRPENCRVASVCEAGK